MRKLATVAAAIMVLAAACSDGASPTTTAAGATTLAATTTVATAPAPTSPPAPTNPPARTSLPTTTAAVAATVTTAAATTTTLPRRCADLAVDAGEDAETSDGALTLHNTTGTELWSIPLGSRLATSFTLTGEVAVAAFADGLVAAILTADCSLLWSTAMGTPAGALIVADGTLIVVDRVNVSAWVLETGNQLWATPWRAAPVVLRPPAAATADGVLAIADSTGTSLARMFTDGQLSADSAGLGEGALTVVAGDGRFYTASDSGRVVAHPPIGPPAWVTQLDMPEPVRLTYDGGVLFAAGLGAVAALDAGDGTVRWQVELTSDGEPAAFMAPARMDHNELHLLDTTGRLHHLDRSDGSTVFVDAFPHGQTFPALDDKFVLVERQGTVRAVNLLGRTRWEITTGANSVDRITAVDVDGSLILAHTFSGERF